MSRESIRNGIQSTFDQKRNEASDPCKNCANLNVELVAGQLSLTCTLSKFGQRDGNGRISGNIGVDWILTALSDDEPRGNEDQRSQLLALRNALDVATDDCPITAKIVSEIPGLPSELLIDLTAPEPIVTL